MSRARYYNKQIGKSICTTALVGEEHLYGKSQNPKIITIKMLCDGLGITLSEFFNTPEFDGLEQEIK